MAFRSLAVWPVFVSAVAGQTSFSTGNFQGILAAGSGVLQSLNPASDTTFDFSPSDYFQYRNESGNYHTGDITLRWRKQGGADWEEIDTAANRNVTPSSSIPNGSLLHSSFENLFPSSKGLLSIERDWKSVDDDLVLSATVKNIGNNSLEIGAFGFPLEFNSIFYNRTADETTAKCVLVDPYMGLDAGYAQVTRLTGTGPNLVITPQNNHSKFEAWRFLYEQEDAPIPYQTQTFEGLYSWETFSKAYAENEWNATTPWNTPTSMFLDAGESVTFALRFNTASNVYDIESVASSAGLPVAVGLPGYILPSDINGKLFISSKSDITSIMIEPTGVLDITPSNGNGTSAWKSFDVSSSEDAFGRARVNINYKNGATQTVHYFVTRPAVGTVEKLGEFLFEKQWYTNQSDPFHRADSIISYDYETQSIVLQDDRVWIAGVSDEAGAGSFEAAAMKSFVLPDETQVAQLEKMVDTSVLKNLQNATAEDDYGVKRSLFFYDPDQVPGYQYDPSFDWPGWNKFDAYSVWRAYDYVHVSALYWSLYRAEISSPGVLKSHNATWYLLHAYKTVMGSQAVDASGEPVTDYYDVGLMCETHWVSILLDLKKENLTQEASDMEASMKSRQKKWSSQSDPYGSEMAWDSTGQEGVYAWSRYFNDNTTMEKTLSSIRGYMPTVAHWGWNGNARRYWDFLYGGKLERVERMIHHYGSGLNALPLLDAYKYNQNPNSVSAFHDLRVGYGGNMGPLSNINSEGFGAMAFHSFPDTMKWDAYSGDYGPNFLGHILGATTFLIEHPDFGWISMGGNVDIQNGIVRVQPKDSVRRNIYVASLGISVELDSGKISEFGLDPAKNVLTVTLEGGMNATKALLSYKDTLGKGVRLSTTGLRMRRGGYVVQAGTSVEFSL